jgi:hypothetical protein
MSKYRNSGYPRIANDHYETPEWVTQALRPHLPRRIRTVWEPCCGSGKMADVLRRWPGIKVRATDLVDGVDFLTQQHSDSDAIITNPPGSRARFIIEHALELTEAKRGMVAMLLRADIDGAERYLHLFGRCPQFVTRVALTKRPRWIPGTTKSPMHNYAWWLWDWRHQGPPTLAYYYDGRREQRRVK